jgi:hypothetical protein
MTQWHNYTILWEPEKTTFLIDDVVAANIDGVPIDPMEAVCFLNNAIYRMDGSMDPAAGYLNLPSEESIAIDYLCVAGLGLWDRDEGFGALVDEMYR